MMRLDKFLSESSSFSRRELRALIRARRVEVDGKVVNSPEFQVSENSSVKIDGAAVNYRKFVYLMLNKPAGYLSATEDKRDPVVVELVPPEYQHYAVFPVGRLDKDTEGLLILTNDGQFDHRLTSPKKSVYKRYFAVLDAPMQPEDIDTFALPMDLGDFVARPAKLEITENACEVFIEIAEGKFHQVKRMCEKVGKNVVYLKRVAIGALTLDETLPLGKVRELSELELAAAEFSAAK